MRTQGRSAVRFLPSAASLTLAAGVASAFSACGMKDDGTWMRCHAAQDAVIWVAAGMTVVLAAAALARRRAVRVVLYALGAGGSVAAFLMPGVAVPLCMMRTMRCHTVMQPFVRIAAVAILILCAVCAARAWRGSARRGPGRG